MVWKGVRKRRGKGRRKRHAWGLTITQGEPAGKVLEPWNRCSCRQLPTERHPLQESWCRHRGSGWAWTWCGATGQSQLLKEHSVLPCQQDNVCLWHDLTSPVPVRKHPESIQTLPLLGGPCLCRACSMQRPPGCGSCS